MANERLQFDIMNCAGWAYQSIWQEKSLLFKVALIPFIVKILFNFLLVTQFAEADLLRKTLVRLPDFFIEAWLLVGFIRLVAFRDSRFLLPFGGSKDAQEARDRRNVRAGILLYVITQLAFAAYNHGIFSFMPDISETETAPDPLRVFGMMAAIILVIRFFNVLWLYIPQVISGELGPYFQATNSMGTSFRFFLVWLVSILPLTLIFFGVFGVILEPFEGQISQAPIMVLSGVTLLQAFYELVIGLVQITGIYYAVYYTRHEAEKLGRK